MDEQEVEDLSTKRKIIFISEKNQDRIDSLSSLLQVRKREKEE